MPIDEWLDGNAKFMAVYSLCPHRRDFFNSIMGSAVRQDPVRNALMFMVNAWDPEHARDRMAGGLTRGPWRGLKQHYSPEDKKNSETCRLCDFCMNQQGTVYAWLGWNATTGRREHQILEEVLHKRGTFEDVPSRALTHDKNDPSTEFYTMCNTIVTDPKSGKVPFYSHTLGRRNCSYRLR